MHGWWQQEIADSGKWPLMLSLIAFVVTFLTTRLITRLIRAGHGPLRQRRDVVRHARPSRAPEYSSGPALARPNVEVLRTFSKLFGLAGLRVGYMIGPPGGRSRRAPTTSGVRRERRGPPRRPDLPAGSRRGSRPRRSDAPLA
jgi:hypothetical protein